MSLEFNTVYKHVKDKFLFVNGDNSEWFQERTIMSCVAEQHHTCRVNDLQYRNTTKLIENCAVQVFRTLLFIMLVKKEYRIYLAGLLHFVLMLNLSQKLSKYMLEDVAQIVYLDNQH